MGKQPCAAVVGAGFIGPVHIEALKRAGVHVAGVAAATAELAREAADALRLPRGYASLEEVLADPEVDAVHLATPNRLHYEHCCAALKAGKHVICEKPLAMDTAQARDLVARAEGSGLATAVCYNMRYYPLCREAAARVRSGRLGGLFHVTGSYVQDWLVKDTDFNWRVLSDEGGASRAVADIGTHWLDLVQYVTGQKVVAVCSDLRTVHPVRHRPIGSSETFTGSVGGNRESEPIEVNTEDCAAVMLRFDGGMNGSLWVSQTTSGRKNCLRYELAGSGGALAWESELPNQLWVGHRDSSNELLARDPSLMDPAAAEFTSMPGGHNEGYPDTFKHLFRDFYSAVESGEVAGPTSFPSFADGLHEIALCEAVVQSHRERRWVEIEEITAAAG